MTALRVINIAAASRKAINQAAKTEPCGMKCHCRLSKLDTPESEQAAELRGFEGIEKLAGREYILLRTLLDILREDGHSKELIEQLTMEYSHRQRLTAQAVDGIVREFKSDLEFAAADARYMIETYPELLAVRE